MTGSLTSKKGMGFQTCMLRAPANTFELSTLFRWVGLTESYAALAAAAAAANVWAGISECLKVVSWPTLLYAVVQRSHQHIFETFPTVVLSALAGSLSFPISTAIATLTYAVGRIAFSNAYAKSEGDASKRYSSKLAKLMWYGLLANITLGVGSCLLVVAMERSARSYFSYGGMVDTAKSSFKDYSSKAEQAKSKAMESSRKYFRRSSGKD